MILSGGYRGLDEVRRLFESVWEIAEWFHVDGEDYVAVGERVVVSLRLSARAKATGLEGEAVTVTSGPCVTAGPCGCRSTLQGGRDCSREAATGRA